MHYLPTPWTPRTKASLALGEALFPVDLYTIEKALSEGADVLEVCHPDPIPCIPEKKAQKLNALCLAASLDSFYSEVFRVPLMLHQGISINHMDEWGGRVLDFATFQPLYDWLVQRGATRGARLGLGRFGIRGVDESEARKKSFEFTSVTGNPLHSFQWNGLLLPAKLDTLRSLGFVGAEGLQTNFLVYLGWPERLIYDVFNPPDLTRITHFLGMGDIPWKEKVPSFSDFSSRTHLVNHAVISDSQAGEPRILSLFQQAKIALNKPDKQGRTPLEVATHPAIQRYLIEAGLDPWAIGSQGRPLFEGLDVTLKTWLEKNRLDTSLGPDEKVNRPSKRL